MEKGDDKPKNERIIILIDGSNFYHSIKDTFGMHDNEVDLTVWSIH